MAEKEKDITMSAVFFIILCLSLILNLMFIAVVNFRRLHYGPYLLLAPLSVINMVTSGIWTFLSVVTTFSASDIPPEMCLIQSFLHILTQSLTAFTLATLAAERFSYTVKPKLHADIFVPNVIKLILTLQLYFCGVISGFYVYGGFPVTWRADQWQCGPLYMGNTNMLAVIFSVNYIIPYFTIAIPMFILAFLKIFIDRRNPPPPGEIVIERNTFSPGDDYCKGEDNQPNTQQTNYVIVTLPFGHDSLRCVITLFKRCEDVVI